MWVLVTLLVAMASILCEAKRHTAHLEKTLIRYHLLWAWSLSVDQQVLQLSCVHDRWSPSRIAKPCRGRYDQKVPSWGQGKKKIIKRPDYLVMKILVQANHLFICLSYINIIMYLYCLSLFFFFGLSNTESKKGNDCCITVNIHSGECASSVAAIPFLRNSYTTPHCTNSLWTERYITLTNFSALGHLQG